MRHRDPPSLVWWWNVLLVMSAIAWGSLVYRVFAGPPAMPYDMYLPAAEAHYRDTGLFPAQQDYHRGF